MPPSPKDKAAAATTATTEIASPAPPPDATSAPPGTMSDDELASTVSTKPATRARPDDEDLADLDTQLSDDMLDRLLAIRAKRLGDGNVVKRGKIYKHTGKFVVLVQIKHCPPGSNEPAVRKVGDIVELTPEDAQLFRFDSEGKALEHPAVEPELV